MSSTLIRFLCLSTIHVLGFMSGGNFAECFKWNTILIWLSKFHLNRQKIWVHFPKQCIAPSFKGLRALHNTNVCFPHFGGVCVCYIVAKIDPIYISIIWVVCKWFVQIAANKPINSHLWFGPNRRMGSAMKMADIKVVKIKVRNNCHIQSNSTKQFDSNNI